MLTVNVVLFTVLAALHVPQAGGVGLAESIPAAGNAWHIALGDTTGDRRPELIYACYDGKVCCQSERTAEVLWQYETGAFPYDLAVGDVTGDGLVETFVASSDGHLYAFGPRGALLWKLQTPAPLYQVALARLDKRTFVFTGGVDRNLYMLDARGRVLRKLPRRRVVRLIAAGDLDGDGRDELVVASHVGVVEAFKSTQLRTLWRTRLRPIVGGKPVRGIWRPYWLKLDDLDGDGRCELLLGSAFYNARGIRVLSHTGTLLWDKPDGFTFRDGTQYSHTELVACDAAPTPGKEIVALNACRLFVFDRRGRRLAVAAAPVSFTDICVRGPNEIYLSSSPNGDDRIYRVRFGKGWERAFTNLKRAGKMQRITENLDKIRRQVLAYKGSAPEGARYVHIVSGGQPNTPQRIRSHFGLIDFYRKRFPYKSCVFAMNINVASTEPVPGFFRPDKRTAGRRLPPGEIPKLLQTCERAKVPFVVTVGHGCEPQIRLETAEAILRACPRYCLGFTCSENSLYGDRLEHYFRDYWFPLMDICKRHGKKALLIEKGAWWATVPAMSRFRKLVDGTYADVLVMSVEDSNSRSPELNLAARAGLYLAGAVNTWSARTIADELCWNRYWEWEFPMSGHPFLRRELAQALLGATFFEYHLSMHKLGRPLGFTTIGREATEILIHMLGKGLLIPPKPKDVMGVSPMLIRMREPAKPFLVESFNFHGHQNFVPNPGERDWPFEGLACHWGAAPVRPNYIGSYLFEQDRHYGAFVPATPYGFVCIVPAFIELKRCRWAMDAWETDGTCFFVEGRRLSGVEARGRVLESFKAAAARLPFRATGHVFVQVQRITDSAVRITLVDPGFLDPGERAVTLHVQTRKPLRELVDLLSGERLPLRANAVRLTVPAGALRVLEARF